VYRILKQFSIDPLEVFNVGEELELDFDLATIEQLLVNGNIERNSEWFDENMDEAGEPQ